MLKIDVDVDETDPLNRYRYVVLPKAIKEEWESNIDDKDTYKISKAEFADLLRYCYLYGTGFL